MLPQLCRGLMIPDLLAILGSLDYVLADIDR
jgi:NADH-quinone oxidoreductase subunit C/D